MLKPYTKSFHQSSPVQLTNNTRNDLIQQHYGESLKVERDFTDDDQIGIQKQNDNMRGLEVNRMHSAKLTFALTPLEVNTKSSQFKDLTSLSEDSSQSDSEELEIGELMVNMIERKNAMQLRRERIQKRFSLGSRKKPNFERALSEFITKQNVLSLEQRAIAIQQETSRRRSIIPGKIEKRNSRAGGSFIKKFRKDQRKQELTKKEIQGQALKYLRKLGSKLRQETDSGPFEFSTPFKQEQNTNQVIPMSPMRLRTMYSPRISGEELDFVEGYANFKQNEFTNANIRMNQFIKRQREQGRLSFQQKIPIFQMEKCISNSIHSPLEKIDEEDKSPDNKQSKSKYKKKKEKPHVSNEIVNSLTGILKQMNQEYPDEFDSDISQKNSSVSSMSSSSEAALILPVFNRKRRSTLHNINTGYIYKPMIYEDRSMMQPKKKKNKAKKESSIVLGAYQNMSKTHLDTLNDNMSSLVDDLFVNASKKKKSKKKKKKRIPKISDDLTEAVDMRLILKKEQSQTYRNLLGGSKPMTRKDSFEIAAVD